MNISSTTSATNLYASYTLMNIDKKNASQQQFSVEIRQFSFDFSSQSFDWQASVANDQVDQNYQEFQSFLESIGYNGKPIASLSTDEASALVSNDGFFGIEQTAQRIADFVILGSNGDESMMREGRKGIMEGFKEAETIWGDTLPDISYKTIEKATELIDAKMHELGYNIMDENA
jgi:hypothetical protein